LDTNYQGMRRETFAHRWQHNNDTVHSGTGSEDVDWIGISGDGYSVLCFEFL